MLGKNIIKMRKKIGLTQEQLAAKMDVTRSSIARWENGLDLPKMANLLELAKTFGISVDQLTNANIDLNLAAPTETHQQREYHKFKKRFARGIAFATMLILFGVAGLLFCLGSAEPAQSSDDAATQCLQEFSNPLELANCIEARGGENESEVADESAIVGSLVLLSAIMLALPFYIILGIQYSTLKKATAKEDRRLPESVKAKVERAFPLQIALGVGLIMVGVIGVVAVEGLRLVPVDSLLPAAALMILIALATFLFVYGGIQKSEITEAEEAQRLEMMGDEQKKQTELVGKLSGVTMMLAVLIYVGAGLFFGSWGWLWPVFPIGGILCGVYGAFFSPHGHEHGGW